MSFRKGQKKHQKRLECQKGGRKMVDDPVDEYGQDMGLNADELELVTATEEDVQSRDREIQAIAQSVNDLAVIFKELAVLVIDQVSSRRRRRRRRMGTRRAGRRREVVK